MFKQAQPIWLKGADALNTFAAFSLETGSLSGATLSVAAADFYRLWVNGRFAAFGPARTARGYARVDELPLGEFDAGDHNTLVIEVAGYNCRTLSTVKQAPFLQAELTRGGAVVAYTGRDFAGYRSRAKVQKVERYSYQRHFSEIWDFRAAETTVDPADACPVEVRKGLGLTQLPRVAPYPHYENIDLPASRASGTLTYDPSLPQKKHNYSVEISERWGGYDDAEIEHLPFGWVQQQRQTVTARGKALPMTLAAGEYAVFDFTRIEVGFFRLALEAAQESAVVIAFSEYCPDDTFVYTDMNVQNTVTYILKAGQTKELLSFEPYTFRFAMVAVKRGSIALNRFGLTTFERDMAGAPALPLQDEALQRIYRGALRTFAHNALDLYTDCPSRERAGWLCDSFFTGKTEYALFGQTPTEDAFLENYARCPDEGLLPPGALPMCYPSDIPDDGKFIPQWTMWYILEVEEYVHKRGHGDKADFFRDSIYGLLSFYRRYENEDGLLERLPSWNFVEWSRANDWTQDVNYPTNFLYAQVLECIDRLYGDEECRARSAQVRKAAIAQSFNGQLFIDHARRDADGRLEPCEDISQIAQYYAILFGGIDVKAPAYRALYDRVLTASFPEGTEPLNAFIGLYLRLETLSRLGEWALMLHDVKDFFGQMEFHTGTLWEYRTFHGSYDHGFASYVASLMLQAAGK